MVGSLDVVINAPYSGSYVDYIPAVTRGLQSFHFPHIDGLNSVSNFAATGDGTIVGAPTYDGNAATFKSLSNYLTTIGIGSTDITMLAVVASDDALTSNTSQPVIMGNHTLNVSGSYFGMDNNAGSPSLLARRVVDNNGTPISGTVARVAFGTQSAYHFVVARFVGGINGYIRVDNITESANSGNISETRTPVVGPAMRIGSSLTTQSGVCRIAFAAHHRTALTDNEVNIVYMQIKSYFAEANVPISI